MERGTLANLQGKTLEEIEIEDELELTDTESGQSEVDCDPSPLVNDTQCSTNQESNESSGDGLGEETSQGRTSSMPSTEKPSGTVEDMTTLKTLPPPHGCRKPQSPVELPGTSSGKGTEIIAPPTEKPQNPKMIFLKRTILGEIKNGPGRLQKLQQC
ncbi:uncharacterized protein LOC129369544 [Poeciliopsis prolifica]|uniref:uncharacterized protein LOC129369544 n=1 Tax=Poeciliopsis prolifica TaxID=188132 RepID=UPI0024132738|nr:uncharacterized protein LOC129369544 [Poeciliopsis prolifica]